MLSIMDTMIWVLHRDEVQGEHEHFYKPYLGTVQEKAQVAQHSNSLGA